MEIRSIVLNKADTVAVLVEPGQPGDTISTPAGPLTLLDAIPTGHKVALGAIPTGGRVMKYGVMIGRASRDIGAGQWVHTHNVEDITEQICNEYASRYRAKAKEGHSV